MRQGTIILVPSAGTALALADAKLQLRIDAADVDQDDYVTQLCAAAHRKVESELGYPILQQTRQTHLSGFPSRGGRHPFFGAYGPVWTAPHGPIWLGGGDSLNVIQVQYYDADGVQQTLDPAAYVLDAVSRPARIVPAPDTGWPETQYRPGAVTIDWQAGWASAADVPDDLIHAMKLLVGHWDQNREGVAVDVRGTPAELPLAFDELLRPYRLPFVA